MSTVLDPMTGQQLTVATGKEADYWFRGGTPYSEWLRAHNRDDGAQERRNASARAFRVDRDARREARIAAKVGVK